MQSADPAPSQSARSDHELSDRYSTTLLFVCGFPGGGTDLVKTVLNAHPEVYINGEMQFLPGIAAHGYDVSTVFETPEAIRSFQATLRGLDTWSALETLDRDLTPWLTAAGRLTLVETLRLWFNDREVRVWGNKTPQNTEALPELAHLFPEARFLIVVRDVRDVCLSWRRKWGRDLRSCAARWEKRMARGRSASERLAPAQGCLIRFEDLLADPEATCRHLCAFLGVSFSAAMLEHHLHMEGPRTDGKINYGRAIQVENRNKWQAQLAAPSVRRIEEIAFTTMKSFGYQPVNASGARPLTRLDTAYGYLHDALAMVFVGNRAADRNGLRQRWRVIRHELGRRLR